MSSLINGTMFESFNQVDWFFYNVGNFIEHGGWIFLPFIAIGIGVGLMFLMDFEYKYTGIPENSINSPNTEKSMLFTKVFTNKTAQNPRNKRGTKG